MSRKLDSLCERVLGGRPVVDRTYSYAREGEIRGTMRVRVGDRTAFATRRQDPRTTAKEARVLKVLSERGAPVPRFLAFEDGWLLMADAGESRLSQHLADAPADVACDLVDGAIDALRAIQRVGAEESLADSVIPFAQGPGVAQRLTSLPETLGSRLDSPPPARDVDAQRALLAVPGHAFVKWDARPSNATVPGGSVVWHDFQHCNRRWPADDLVWLLCDEAVPHAVEPARRLADLARKHGRDEGFAPGAALDYVASLGTAHVLTRLNAHLDAREKHPPVTWAECLAEDWVGAPDAIHTLLRRGAAVAALSPLTAPLAPWFASLAGRGTI